MFRFVTSLAILLLGSAPMSAMAQNPNQLAVSSSQGIRLEGNGPTRIPLVNAAARPGETGRLGSPRGNVQTYLVLQNIFAKSPPGVGYDVYLDLPAGQAPGGREDRHYVGTFHFFDTSPSHPREARLNITQSLKALAAEGQLSSTPSVTVVPAAATQAESQIGSVAIEAE
jgi:hypothetical protein